MIGATILGGGVTWGVLWLGGERAVVAILAMLAGAAAAIPLIWRELRLLMRL